MVSILQGYPLSDLTVKGLWQVASGETRAIVLTPRNEGVVVKEGDPIASGKVLSIKRDQLQVRLYRLRSDGVREYEDVSLKIGSTNHQVKGVIKMEPGKESRLGKSVGDDFREGKITLPVILSYRRGTDTERAFWNRTLTEGQIAENDLEHALSLMKRHKAIEATFERARHYGAIARDALVIFPDSVPRKALADVVQFCVSRAN